MYDKKSINIDQVMKHAKKDIYFKDVHLFIEKIKAITTIQDQAIRRNETSR